MAKTKDPGLGSSFDKKLKRMVNEDGSYNIRRIGALSGVRDFYKFLIDMSWWKFISLAFGMYLFVSAIFATIYVLIGIEQLNGIDPQHSNFLNAFFFSVQTVTTIGYGHITPSGLAANLIAVVESFIGLLSIALITGLLYGRFSKPSSKITFTKHILLTPYKNGQAVMFKMVNQRNSTLLNASVKLVLIMDQGVGENETSKDYFQLNLQIDSVQFFPLTWTIVHEIDEESPLFGMDLSDIRARSCEVLALVEAFDETHHQTVIERRSYAEDQWISNVRFARNYRTTDKGTVELFIGELDKLEEL